MATPKPPRLDPFLWPLIVIALIVPSVIAVFSIVSLFASAFPSTFTFTPKQVYDFLDINAVATFVGDGFLALVIWAISRSRPREDLTTIMKQANEDLRAALREDREANARVIADAITKALRKDEEDTFTRDHD